LDKIKKLRIGSIDYRVKSKKHLQIGDELFNGLCHFDKALIELLETMPDERKRQVLIHEVTHALLHEAGYHYDDDGVHSEENVVRISNVLDGFLKDNIKLLNTMYK